MGERLEGDGELLERAGALATLGSSLAAVAAGGHGRLVLVGGEAGVGKTALVRRFCAGAGDARVLWGACEVLFTPRPLGPLLDVARATETGLGPLIASGAKPYEVADSLMAELGARAPTILVLEDVHWADEATLDVLRLLARRLDAVPALVLATYRDDGLDRSHPLRIVLGELATAAAVDRIGLAPLSPAAVAVLAGPHGVDPGELYRRTAGNPFFVTEALAAGDVQVPATVRDAVLARAARLSPAAAALLEAVAVVPPPAELWLVGALAGEAAEGLDECLAGGMLVATGQGVAFRHELARLAVEASLGPHRRLSLHRAALAALVGSGTGEADAARLTHHAEGAGDADMVVRFAPAAGASAATLGAHREAAAQYARALRVAGRLAPAATASGRATACGRSRACCASSAAPPRRPTPAARRCACWRSARPATSSPWRTPTSRTSA